MQLDGEEWRTAMINIPVFVANTPEAFAAFLVASSPVAPAYQKEGRAV